ncbi:MAG: endonuclease III [Bacillota bacterium]
MTARGRPGGGTVLKNTAIIKVLEILQNCYPEASTALDFENPFQLLVATMLSAQCTDKQVNKITARLFIKYRMPDDFAALEPEELAKEIQGCGLYRNKSRHIVQTCRMLVRDYAGMVPETMEELTDLPGVGRKTANVVLSNAFHQPAIAVDTHVFRVANRIGLASSKNVLGTEEDLRRCIPRHLWSDAPHWLIFHGRSVCRARNPRCGICPVQPHCKKARQGDGSSV